MDIMISIVVPVYNSEDYLEKCILSILNQSYKKFELLLIDDGSYDNSGALCDKYSTIDKRVKVFHMPNQGPSTARNIGISAMTGEYLMFVDSDDELLDNTLSELITILEEQVADVIIFGYRVQRGASCNDVKPPSMTADKTEFGRIYISLCENYLINSPCNKVYKKDLINQCRFPTDMKLGEDLLFCNSYLRLCNSFLLVDKPLYLYKTRETRSLTTKYYPDIFEWYIKHYDDTAKTMSFFDINWDRKNCNQLYRIYGNNVKKAINLTGSFLNRDSLRFKLVRMKRICKHCFTRECLPYIKGNVIYLFLLRNSCSFGLWFYIKLSEIKKRKNRTSEE